MAPVIPTVHPTSVRAGDTWRWKIAFTDYPVSESWVLSYALTCSSSDTQEPLTWDVSWVTNDGSQYTVTIPISATDDFRAGNYILTAFVTLSGQRYSPYSAPLQIEADSASLATSEGLTHAEKTLAILETQYAALAAERVTGYSVGQRAATYHQLAELGKQIAKYRERVWRERKGSAMGGPPLVVQFGSPSVSAWPPPPFRLI